MLKHTLRTISSIPIHGKARVPDMRRFFTTINQKVCHYDILEIKPTATVGEIKKAYYKKVKLYHPDHNHTPEAEEQFKIIAKAYETLKDPISRQIYDLSRTNPHFNADYQADSEGSSAYSQQYSANQDKAAYYNNKWYGYGTKKPQEDTLRDEYDGMRDNIAQTSIFDNLLFRAGLVVGIIVTFDLWHKYQQRKHNDFVLTQREVLEPGKSAFESPLVFVKKAPEAKVEVEKVQESGVDVDEYIDERKIRVKQQEDSEHNEF